MRQIPPRWPGGGIFKGPLPTASPGRFPPQSMSLPSLNLRLILNRIPSAPVWVVLGWLCMSGLAPLARAQEPGIEEQVVSRGEGIELGGEHEEQLMWKAGRWIAEGSLEWGPAQWEPGDVLTGDAIQNFEGNQIQPLVAGAVVILRARRKTLRAS